MLLGQAVRFLAFLLLYHFLAFDALDFLFEFSSLLLELSLFHDGFGTPVLSILLVSQELFLFLHLLKFSSLFGCFCFEMCLADSLKFKLFLFPEVFNHFLLLEVLLLDAIFFLLELFLLLEIIILDDTALGGIAFLVPHCLDPLDPGLLLRLLFPLLLVVLPKQNLGVHLAGELRCLVVGLGSAQF